MSIKLKTKRGSKSPKKGKNSIGRGIYYIMYNTGQPFPIPRHSQTRGFGDFELLSLEIVGIIHSK